MWPTSSAWISSSGLPQRGHGSPAATSRRSAHWPTVMSRATSTPVRWTSSVLAPVDHAGRPCSARSAMTGRPVHPDRAQAARARAQRGHDLVGLGRPDARPRRCASMQLLRRSAGGRRARSTSVSWPSIDLDQRLDLPVGGQRRTALGQGLDGPHAGRGEAARARPGRRSSVDRRQRRGGLLHVGRVVAAPGSAATRSSPAVGRAHELDRAAAAHAPAWTPRPGWPGCRSGRRSARRRRGGPRTTVSSPARRCRSV